MPTYESTKRGYANLWNEATILPARQAAATNIAKKIRSEPWLAALKQVEAATGVPDFLVGCLLERESGLQLDTYLGNGEKLDRVTTLVPANRGPFLGPNAFLDGAVDALKAEGMVGIRNWSVPLMLYFAEKFNGFGYYGHDVNDPYVWSWTSLYTKGKFVKDGPQGWDATFVDPQPGVAAILKALAEVDATVAARLTMDPSAVAAPTQAAAQTPATTPAAPKPAPASPLPAPATPSKQNPGKTPATQETTMPNAAAQTTAVAPVDPIPGIIAALESIKKFVPFITGIPFVPPQVSTIANAAIPICEEILQMIEAIENKSGVDLFQTIGQHIQAIGQHVQTTATAVAAAPAASGAPTQGMPNAG